MDIFKTEEGYVLSHEYPFALNGLLSFEKQIDFYIDKIIKDLSDLLSEFNLKPEKDCYDIKDAGPYNYAKIEKDGLVFHRIIGEIFAENRKGAVVIFKYLIKPSKPKKSKNLKLCLGLNVPGLKSSKEDLEAELLILNELFDVVKIKCEQKNIELVENKMNENNFCFEFKKVEFKGLWFYLVYEQTKDGTPRLSAYFNYSTKSKNK